MISLINFGQDFIRFLNSKNHKIEITLSIKKDIPLTGERIIETTKHKFFNYKRILSFIVLNDGVIVCFEPSADASNEEKRRNILKFNEDGELLWIVEDKYIKIWKERDFNSNRVKERIKINNKFLDLSNEEKHKNTPFNNIYIKETYPNFKLTDPINKIITDETNGNYFSLDIQTGEVEYLKTIKD